jgi:hypothetical protein
MWLGHLCRMQELDPYRKLTFLNQKAFDWLRSLEEDLKNTVVRNWRRN